MKKNRINYTFDRAHTAGAENHILLLILHV